MSGLPFGTSGGVQVAGQYVSVPLSGGPAVMSSVLTDPEVRQEGVKESTATKVNDYKSVILVLHKIAGLQGVSSALLTERRLYCSVTFGSSSVRTAMATSSNVELGEVSLDFIIRMPLPPQNELQALNVSLMDAATSSTVAFGRLEADQLTARNGITVNELKLHPLGCLRYHVRLNQQPTGSASVQHMSNTSSAPDMSRPMLSSVPPPPVTYARIPYPHTMASIPQIPPATARYSIPGRLGAERSSAHVYSSEFSGGALRPPPEISHYRASTMTAASLPIGARFVGQFDPWTHRTTSPSPMDAYYTPSSHSSNAHIRSASEGLRPRRLITRGTAPREHIGTPTGTYVRADDGRLHAVSGMRSSPLGQSVLERLSSQQTAPILQSHVRSQRSGTPLESSSSQASLAVTTSNVETGPSIPLAEVSQLVEAPAVDRTQASCPDLSDDLSQISQLQNDMFRGDTPRGYSLKVVHPFRSVSLRIESLLQNLKSPESLCSLGFTSSDGTVTKDVVCISLASNLSAPDAHPPTLLLPVNLNRKDVSLHVVISSANSATSRLEIPLQGLLRSGRSELSGSAHMTGSVPHTFVFALRLLAVPFQSPILMSSHSSRYVVTVMSPSLDQQSISAFDTRPASNLEIRQTRSESASEDHSTYTGNLSCQTGVSGASPENDFSRWNHLCVTVTGIDDSDNPVPEIIDGESTKDLYCKVSLGTTTALRAKFVGWRQAQKKLPDFEFEHKGERVLKISLVGTTPQSKLNLGICRIDLNALLKTGRSYFRGKVPLTGSEDYPNPPHLNLTFRFNARPVADKVQQNAASWRQALQGCRSLKFTLTSLESADLSALRHSYCVRLSCGRYRFKSPRLELTEDNKFLGPVSLVCEVDEEFLDVLDLKPLVVCIYVKIPTAATQQTNSHAAYQFCRLSPPAFVIPSEPPRSAKYMQEMSLAPEGSANQPRCTIAYTLMAE